MHSMSCGSPCHPYRRHCSTLSCDILSGCDKCRRLIVLPHMVVISSTESECMPYCRCLGSLLPVVCSAVRLTCCSNVTVPAVGAFQVDETQRGCSQLDKAQVHEQGWSGDGKRLPFRERSAYKICQNSAKEQHLQHVSSSKHRFRNSGCENHQESELYTCSHFAIGDVKTS